MLKYHQIYQINEIPDLEYLDYQKFCPDGVQKTISTQFGYLLKRFSVFKVGDVEVTLRIIFNPASKQRSLQSRMSIFLISKTCTHKVLKNLKTTIKQGLLSKFYNFISVDDIDLSWDKINEISLILRDEKFQKSSISNDLNYQALSDYYSPQQFEANEYNDLMDLIKTLDKINEKVIIDIAVKPIQIKSLCLSHANYLSKLKDINNSWGINDDEISPIDYFDNNNTLYSQQSDTILNPLKIKDQIADEILSNQQKFHESLYSDHLAFNIRIFSETAKVNSLITSCVADSGFRNGHYQSFSLINHTKEFKTVLESAKQLNFHDITFSKTKSQKYKDLTIYDGLAPLNQCATTNELSGIFRLPVASIISPSCIRKNTDPMPVSNETTSIPLGDDMEISDFLITLTSILICKHMFITGMSGVGKTTTIFNIMLYLWDYKVPFIVIESAKTEYRNLKRLKRLSGKKASNLAKNLQIYTPGNERFSPFRINPLKIPKNVSRDNHIATLLSLLQSAISVSGPLPALITEALERVYEKYPDNQHPPILKDLLNTIQEVLNEKSYSPETLQDIMTAIEVRLKSLTSGSIGKVFQCQHNIPDIHELTKAPSVIELEGLSNEQKCFLTLIILTRITEHFKTISQPNSKLKFVILIEEAHNIIGRTFNASPSPDNPDPKSYITEFICRLLAELRSLGVGVVIIDQLPSAVAPQVIKNTATKLAFRQVDREDREILGSSMLLKEYETENMAILEPGEAYFLTEGMYRPRKVKLFNLRDKYKF